MDDPQPVDLAMTSIDILRERVDLWNRRFIDLSSDLDRIDATLADAINDHHQNRNKRQTDNAE